MTFNDSSSNHNATNPNPIPNNDTDLDAAILPQTAPHRTAPHLLAGGLVALVDEILRHEVAEQLQHANHVVVRVLLGGGIDPSATNESHEESRHEARQKKAKKTRRKRYMK